MISERNIPPTYDLIKKGKTTIVVKDAYRKTFIKMGINEPERFLSRFTENSDCYQGRGALKTMPFPENEKEQMIIRHYRRGGRMQKFTADIYWGASRPLRELWVGYQAMDKGLPTAEIIAACHTQVFWLFHRGDLISREIKNGIDLIRYLQGLLQPLTKEKILQKRKVIQSVGKIIRKMHEVGISHGDLHLKNILLQINDPQEINIYIIDFDKSSATSQLNENKR
ncbi:MAG: lipopolysaccharide kinase InaA family protein, partial [Pseudomonadota bacterium]